MLVGPRGSCLAASGAELKLGSAVARARPLAALGRGSVGEARAGPGEARCSPARGPLPGSLALSLARSASALGLCQMIVHITKLLLSGRVCQYLQGMLNCSLRIGWHTWVTLSNWAVLSLLLVCCEFSGLSVSLVS